MSTPGLIKVLRGWVAVMLCLMLAACDGHAENLLSGGCGLGPPMPLPVEMHGRAAVVSVTINNHPAHLILDTGSNVTVINKASTAALGIDVTGSFDSAFTAIGGNSKAEKGRIADLVVGHAKIPSLTVVVASSVPEDGVLGLDVLSRFDVDIDLLAAKVTLYPGKLCPQDQPPMLGGLLEIPAERSLVRGEGPNRTVAPFLMVPVRLNGVVAMAVLDSGALRGTLVSPPFAAKAGVGGAALAPDKIVKVNGFGTDSQVRLHRFDELLVGREVFDKPMLLVGGGVESLFQMVIGSDYFDRHRIWFSFSSDRVFVVPHPH